MSSLVHFTAEERKVAYGLSFSHIPEVLLFDEKFPPYVKGMLKGWTVMNILGYFPLVSTVSGIARIIFTLSNNNISHTFSEKKQWQAFQEAQLVRGGIECLSVLSPLLFVVDTVVSIFFLCQKQK